MTTILLAVDETEASERAVRFAEHLFGGQDVEMVAVNVARAPLGWASAAAAGVPPVPFGGYYPWPGMAGVAPLTSPAAEQSARAEEEAAREVAAGQAPPGAEVEALITCSPPLRRVAGVVARPPDG